jgi:hypothetical protein
MNETIKKYIDKDNFFFSIIVISFILLNIFYYWLFVLKYPDYLINGHELNINAITHTYNDIILNLLNKGKYYSNFSGIPVDFYAARLPFIPYFLVFLIIIFKNNFFLILLFKNLFLFSFLLFIAKKTLKKNIKILVFIILIFLIPFNLQNFLMFIPEEGYINYFIASLFLLLFSDIKHKDKYVSFILFILFFIKGSLCFFLYAIDIYFFFYEKKKLPFISLFACYLIWASYVFIKTERIISPVSLVSIGGLTLIFSNNDKFNDIYPLQSPDDLSEYIFDKHGSQLLNFKNEVQVDEYFKEKNIDYIVNNKLSVINAILKKLYVVFFLLEKDGQTLNSQDFGKIRYSNIFNHLIVLIVFYIIIKNIILIKKLTKNHVQFLIFFASYLFPFIVGFVYTRHLVPIFIVSIIFILFEYFIYSKNK